VESISFHATVPHRRCIGGPQTPLYAGPPLTTPVMTSVATTTLQEHRTAFLDQVNRYVTHHEECKRFAQVLDYFIAWSHARGDVVPLEADYNEHAVSFMRTSDRAVLWTASPIRGDGARFEVLPRMRRALSEEQLRDAKEVFTSLNIEASEDSILRVRFAALKAPATRERVTALMERLLAS